MRIKINILSLILIASFVTSINNYVFASENDKFGIYGFYLGQTLEEAREHAKKEGWIFEIGNEDSTIASTGAFFLRDFFKFDRPESQILPLQIREGLDLISGRVVQKLPNDKIKYRFNNFAVYTDNPRVRIELSFQSERNSNSVPKLYYIKIDANSLNMGVRDKFYSDVNNTMKKRYGNFNYKNKYQEGWNNGNYYILNQTKGNKIPYFIDKKPYEEYIKYYIDMANMLERQAKSKM